uniref:Zinc metalloproteinase n=1 Tax=Caenorhabditis japonica TaxID=281687 RepID=A0A8R1HPU0_CAEJA
MASRTCPIAFLILIGLASIATAAYIANDVVSDYAEVKELLAAFYRKHAKKYGHDYDPAAIQAIAENMNKSIKEDKTEATVNRKLWNEVFENDIILTLPQAESLLTETNNPRMKRQAHPDPRNFWPNLTISYEFYGGEETWRQLIRSAIRHVEQNVCFRFKENGNDRDGLRYYRGNGCWSNVGRIGGRQLVSIGYGCDSLGIVSHETLHALGLWHEQSRDDRDNYISIATDKITRGTEGNFAKRTSANSDNLGQPYDLGSVMHYGAKAFSYDWTSDTIKTRDWRYQNTIGQRDGLSFKDAKMINLRYCSNVCSRQLPCLNEGYTDPNNCNKCRCPAGYGGTYCETVEYTSCGGSLTATSSYQKIESGIVQADANCVWRIRNPGGNVEVVFDSLNFQCSDPCQSYVEVKWLSKKVATGARLCCSLPSVIRSEGDDVLIIYRGSQNTAYGWKGFTLRYRAIGGSPATLATARPVYTTTTRPYWTKTASGWIHIEHPPLYTPEGEVYTSDERSSSEEYQLFDPSTSSSSSSSSSSPALLPVEGHERPSAPPPEHDLSQLSQAFTRPTPTTYAPDTASWSDWGEWSVCSQPCGGCGTRTRVRACYGGNQKCPGSNLEKQGCNAQACAKPKKGMICNGRLLLPCDLLATLKFGSNNYLNPKLKQSGFAHASTLPLPRISQRKPVLRQELEVHPPTNRFYSSSIRRVKRQTATRFCEKRFIYQCPSALLTINMEYKASQDEVNDAYFQQYPECCSGYTPRSGVCYKN